MRTEINIDFIAVVILLGVSQGLFLSWFFIKNRKANTQANLFQGLLLIALSQTMLEELLNHTGYIVKVLEISNFAEPFNFSFAPLLFLYTLRTLKPQSKKTDWLHFIPFVFWLGYCFFHYIQPVELKYNAYLGCKHPDWEFLNVQSSISEDPLGLRGYINELTQIQITIYLILIFRELVSECKKNKTTIFNTQNELIKRLRNSGVHFMILLIIYILVKVLFGGDIGDYFISMYITLVIFTTSYQILNRSTYFDSPASFFDIPALKYQKSSLNDKHKERILKKIENEFTRNKYFTSNLASLKNLSQTINESQHHVSQAINEGLNKNFFELLASYRIDEAKNILSNKKSHKYTIEEIAEQVGYNSKSAFNNAFKKLTGQTPSEFRKNAQ